MAVEAVASPARSDAALADAAAGKRPADAGNLVVRLGSAAMRFPPPR